MHLFNFIIDSFFITDSEFGIEKNKLSVFAISAIMGEVCKLEWFSFFCNETRQYFNILYSLGPSKNVQFPNMTYEVSWLSHIVIT